MNTVLSGVLLKDRPQKKIVKHTTPWYRGAVAYQIYPRSFYDSNGDGVGDLRGIISKLDYLAGKRQSLGVDAIWLTPFYKSPMVDFGYDVADYYSVDPIFGSNADFKLLLKAAHRRGLRVIIDFVTNHTSDRHPWFVESKSAKANAKRDWYVWRDPKAGRMPPNNWRSVFGGSAWQYEPLSGQYYLHSFATQQPDLNWDNQQVREAMQKVMRFWLDMGVDGFRVDAVNWLAKDRFFRDDPLKNNHQNRPGDYQALDHIYSRDAPELYDYLRSMTSVIREYEDRFMVFESYPEESRRAIAEYLKLYEALGLENSAPFNFEGIRSPWDARTFKFIIDEYQSNLNPKYVPVYTLGNHDKHRLASRVGDPATRTAAVMLLCLPGMPFIYYGEEIGMKDVFVEQDEIQDRWFNDGESRDAVRTPMQWDSSQNAGFSQARPWLPVEPDYHQKNVILQQNDPESLLNLYRRLINLRKSSDALKIGAYEALDVGEGMFGFIRRYADEKMLVLLNFGSTPVTPKLKNLEGSILLSTHADRTATATNQNLVLKSHEGLIIQLH